MRAIPKFIAAVLCGTQLVFAAEPALGPESNAARELWVLVDKLDRAAPFTRASVEAAVGMKLRGYTDAGSSVYSTGDVLFKNGLWMDSLIFRIDGQGNNIRARIAMLLIRDRSSPTGCVSEMDADKHFGLKPDRVWDDSNGHAFAAIWKYYKRPWGEIAVAIPWLRPMESSRCVGEIYFDSPGLETSAGLQDVLQGRAP